MRYIVMVLILAAAIGAGVTSQYPAAEPLPSSVVKVLAGEGHGSGVHIGNGYIVTAAHVTRGMPASILLDDGSLVGVEVLWENKAHDIALLRTEARMATSPLACRVADVGERITAYGSPGSLDFLSSDGKVAGAARSWGPWASVLPVDMTIVMGMSGGPTLDRAGNVVGISVGVMLAQVGFGASLTGFGAIVPSASVCALMGRT